MFIREYRLADLPIDSLLVRECRYIEGSSGCSLNWDSRLTDLPNLDRCDAPEPRMLVLASPHWLGDISSGLAPLSPGCAPSRPLIAVLGRAG